MDPNNEVRIERLDNLIEDLSSIVDDLAEFFGDEFAGSGNLLDQVVQTMQDALMEARACD